MLVERIDILQNASVISQTTAMYVKDVIAVLEKKFTNKESILEMFTTHLAMATQRILDHAEVETLDDGIWMEVSSSPVFQEALETYEDIKKHAPCSFPKEEEKFLIMHLCNLHQ